MLYLLFKFTNDIYENDRPTVLARDLHDFLEVKTAFKDWFPRMCEYGCKNFRGLQGCRIGALVTCNPQNDMYVFGKGEE